jgi:hypothetical protein
MQIIEYISLIAIIIGAIIFASPKIVIPNYKILACSIYEIGVVIQFTVALSSNMPVFILSGIIFFVVNLWGIYTGFKSKK